MLNESFWLAVSLVVFVCLVFKHAKAFILASLVDRIQSVDSKFKEVFAVSEEADMLLKEYRLLHRSSKKKVKDILKSAELEINQIKKEAEQEVSIKLSSRNKNILNAIYNSEQKVLSELRLDAVQLAVSTSIEMLSSDKSSKQQKQLVINSIDAISSQVKANTLNFL